MKKKLRVAFVVSHPYIEAMACFHEPISAMADQDWQVDVYTGDSPYHPKPRFKQPNIRTYFFGTSGLDYFYLGLKLAFARPSYDWIIAVPQRCLFYASLAAKLSGSKLVCFSDEIYSSERNLPPMQKRWKNREIKAHKACEFTIALDPSRADFVRRENGIRAEHPIFVVPNSLPGVSEKLKSHYYQEKLDIPEDKKILLHTGSSWWKNDFLEISKVARQWKNSVTLVFQNRFQDKVQDTHERMKVSDAILPYEQLTEAVSSAHIGLALYKDTGINLRSIGLSSGKILLYMKCSLPVITTRLPSLLWVEKEGCGILVDDISGIEAACDKILANYDTYVRNVKRFYDQNLNFKKNFEPVLKCLQK